MDIISVVSLALSVPIAIFFVIFGSVFLASGYKNSFWRSLVSLGATIVAILISFLLGKLAGILVAAPACAGILDVILKAAPAEAGMIKIVLQSVIQVALTLFFFGLFMIISLAVCKKIGKSLPWEKVQNDPVDGRSMRLAGMGIRFLDAIIVTLALLLPLYGTLAFAASPLSTVANMAGADNEVAAVLNAVEQHPTTKIYKSGPAASLYRGLSTANIGGESFGLASMAETVAGTVRRFDAFTNSDGQQRADALSDLTQYLLKNVVEEPWCYNLVTVAQDELKKINEPVPQQIAQVLEMSELEFKENSVALLSFVNYALDNGFMTFYDSSDYEALPEEYYVRLGELLNFSDQAIELKKMLMKESAVALFRKGWDSDAEEIATAQASEFIDQYITNTPLTKEQYQQEGEAFMLMTFAHSDCDVLEAFVRYPSIQCENVLDLIEDNVLAELYGDEYTDLDISRILPLLQAKLSACETAPIRNVTSKEYFQAVISVGAMLDGCNHDDFTATDALLQELLDNAGNDFFKSDAVSAKKVKKLLTQALDEAKQKPGVRGWVCLERAYNGESDTVFEVSLGTGWFGVNSETGEIIFGTGESLAGDVGSFDVNPETGEIIFRTDESLVDGENQFQLIQ